MQVSVRWVAAASNGASATWALMRPAVLAGASPYLHSSLAAWRVVGT